MIHVITPELRKYYRRQLLEVHQLRAELFIGRRGWKALRVREDGGEYDAYDDDRMVYLTSLMADGAIGVCQRLRPADDKSMIHDIFPHLLAPGEVALGFDTVEGSRHFLSPAFRKSGDRRPIDELTVAVMETAAGMGARRMIAIVDVFGMQSMMSLGWPVRWLGLPATYAEGECIACEVETTPETIAATRERLGFPVEQSIVLAPAKYGEWEKGDVHALLLASQSMPDRLAESIAKIVNATAHLEATQGEAAALAFIESVERQMRGGALA